MKSPAPAPATAYAVEASALGKRYGATWALQDCSFALPTGRVVGLVGPNGAGKTTLLHLAMGLLAPTVGDIRIYGHSPRREVHDVLRRVGFVAQNRPLYRHFTVAQLLEYGKRLNTRWDDERARERLRQYAIPLNRKAGKLSGGQQAQVSLALALAKRPDLLLLDEPMANLDPLARQEFLRTMLDAAADDGMTVVFSSHIVSELGRFCDYLMLITEGRLRLAGDLDQVLAGHRRLTAAAELAPDAEHLPGVVATTVSGSQVNVVVRLDAWSPVVSQVGWEEAPVRLSEVVLAYLTAAERRAATPAVESSRSSIHA